MFERHRSRIARSASEIGGRTESEALRRLDSVPVVVVLGNEMSDGHFSFLTALRLAILTFGHVRVCLPRGNATLVRRVQALSRSLLGARHPLRLVDVAEITASDYVLAIGAVDVAGGRTVLVRSRGWIAELVVADRRGNMATGVPAAARRGANAIGSAGAAALGVGELFLLALGLERPPTAFECSFLTYETGDIGSLATGPAIRKPMTINGIQIGAGTVGGAFDYVSRQLPITGNLAIVDPQRVGPENYGPHLLVGKFEVSRPKAELAVNVLKGRRKLRVKGYSEPVQLFALRLGTEVGLPGVVVSGLDRALPRHAVQRLWAPLHVDMATGGFGGLQSQVLVRTNPGSGRCMIAAFSIAGEGPDEERWADMTGMREGRFKDPMSFISTADIEAAPPDKRPQLLEAVNLGHRVCNVVIASELGATDAARDFAASAPFNALLAGTMAAGELVKAAGSNRDGVFVQYSLIRRAFFVEHTSCASDCECSSHVSSGTGK